MSGSAEKTKLTYGDLRTNAEKIIDAELKERILRGIEVLNEFYGPDWVDKIDPSTLDLSRATRCVLGQVYDDDRSKETGFDRGLEILGIDQAASYGFDTEDEDYEELQEGWLVALGEET